MRDLKSGMGEFKVNGRTYKFDLLPPMEAIDFGSRVLKAAGGALYPFAVKAKCTTTPLLRLSALLKRRNSVRS